MIAAEKTRKIRVLFTPFRDGIQSAYGGRVRVEDLLPAVRAAAEAGIRHFELGGGGLFQASYYSVGEDPFERQDELRDAVGPDAALQVLTRSVSGVTLTAQRLEALELQARLMRRHGATWDRNFDFLNDIDNLIRTGRPIVAAGMHHQVCVAMMGLPSSSDDVHTAERYVDVVRRLLASDLHFDSVCMKDASGTADPRTCYETAKALRGILPPEVLLWQHTHDTASLAVACYLAGIEGGVDGVDLSVRPLASGTVQPDVRSMARALRGTGCELDVAPAWMPEIGALLREGLAGYALEPVTTMADARVLASPMAGGAIGPNVQMMKEAGILDRYGDVLAEVPVVIEAAGAWASVTPGSQHYWQQAFENVLHGRWERIDPGFGRSVLGYFGRPPRQPDPAVARVAAEQLGLEPFGGDPLEAAPDGQAAADQALTERGLPHTDENRFLVAASIVPGRSLDLNEGIRLLEGTPKVTLPVAWAEAPRAAAEPGPALTRPVTTTCTVEEGGRARTFRITLEAPAALAGAVAPMATPGAAPVAAPAALAGTPVCSPFSGKVELVEVRVQVGDRVTEGQVVAAVEAMKAKHDVRAPVAGKVVTIDAQRGDDIVAGQSIMTLAP